MSRFLFSLGFAAWTLLTLFGSIGVYRWSRILTGRASISEWRADYTTGQRVVSARHARAHQLRGELADIWGARSRSDGDGLAQNPSIELMIGIMKLLTGTILLILMI